MRRGAAYDVVGGVADLLAYELVRPLLGLVAGGVDAGDDERHGGGCGGELMGESAVVELRGTVVVDVCARVVSVWESR